ncbi:MAG: ComF family protein [Candidatus Firestonebacteria bacterium]
MKNILTGILDAVFPANCKTCGKKMKADRAVCFCGACWSTIRKIKEPFCVYCGKQLALPNEHFCADCTVSRLSFVDNRSAGVYEGVLKEAIHEFKYKGKKRLGKCLGKLMVDYLKENGGLDDIDLIIPVPISENKIEKREYNQAEILAGYIGRSFEIPVLKDVLERTKDTSAQYELSRDERFRNVNGAFDIKHPEKIKWACILLVDDLLTSGATADECSRMLLGAGASQIRVFTLARGL